MARRLVPWPCPLSCSRSCASSPRCCPGVSGGRRWRSSRWRSSCLRPGSHLVIPCCCRLPLEFLLRFSGPELVPMLSLGGVRPVRHDGWSAPGPHFSAAHRHFFFYTAWDSGSPGLGPPAEVRGVGHFHHVRACLPRRRFSQLLMAGPLLSCSRSACLLPGSPDDATSGGELPGDNARLASAPGTSSRARARTRGPRERVALLTRRTMVRAVTIDETDVCLGR